jgi:hypothetical protein
MGGLGRWVATREIGGSQGDRWPAKLLAPAGYTATLWVRVRTCIKNTKCVPKAKERPAKKINKKSLNKATFSNITYG